MEKMTKQEGIEAMYQDGSATLEEAILLFSLELGWNAAEAKDHLIKLKVNK